MKQSSLERSPNLVLIQGTTATRYVNGKADQVVNIDYSVGIKNVKADIEYFRVNGVEIEETVV
jgi:hypothetical protein